MIYAFSNQQASIAQKFVYTLIADLDVFTALIIPEQFI